jgi:predicted  nucleic acid-binding Zn ribbon protein
MLLRMRDSAEDKAQYGKYFTTRCPQCHRRMEYLPVTRVWGYKGRYASNEMCCHRCKHNWHTIDELTLTGGLIVMAEMNAYNPPDETLWIED